MSQEKTKRSRWWRWAGWIALTLVVLAGLILVGLEVAVRQPGVRSAIKGRLESEVETRTGLSLHLDDLRLSLLHGYVEFDGIAVGGPDDAPVLQVQHLEAEWRLSSIWNRPLTLKQLNITRPEVDLEAPLPAVSTDSPDQSSVFNLVIEQFRLEDGRVDGPVLPVELESWIEDWWLQDLTIEGEYGPERLELVLQSAAHWLRSDEVEVEMAIEGRLEGPQGGPWDLSQLTLQADGIEGNLIATLGLGATDPLEGEFDLVIEPHLLIPVPPSAEPVRAKGDFDARRESGLLHLVAKGLPVQLASPWISADTVGESNLAGWALDLDADLALAGSMGKPSGLADLRVLHAGDPWVTGEIELLSESPGGGVGARVEVSMLPDKSGRRSISATIEAPLWEQLDALMLSEGLVEIEDTDLAEIGEVLVAVWPGPLPSALEEGMVGLLRATAKFEGPIASPQAELEGSWRDGSDTWVELRGSGSTNRVLVESFNGVIEGRRFEGSGSLDLPAPIMVAEVQLEVEQPLPEVEHLSLSAVLDSGTLLLELQPRTSNGAISHLKAELPLGELAGLPKVGDAVAGLPIVQARGPVNIAWEIPETEWGELISRVGRDLPLSVSHFGSTGSVQLDLSRPLASRGEVVVNGLDIGKKDFGVASDSPIVVHLDGGELILEPTRLSSSGGTLELEIWSDLDADWQPGASIERSLERFRVEANGNVPVALLNNFVDEVLTDGDLQVGVSVTGTPESLTGEFRVLGQQASALIGGPDGVRVADPLIEILFEDDRVRVHQARLGVDDGEVGLTGEASLATLRAMLSSERLDADQDLEPLGLRVEVAPAEWASTLGKLGFEEAPESLRLGGLAELTIDPSRPLEASGWLEIDPFAATIGDHRVSNEGPIRLELDAERLVVAQFGLNADGQPFELTGAAALDPSWSPEQPPVSLVERFSFQGHGTLAAALLNPILAGGSADGLLQVDFEVGGSLADPTGSIRIAGPTASVVYFSPYVAKIEAPELDIELADGRAHIRDGRVRLNDGDVELGGSLGLDGLDVTADFDGLRFRLDYGLLAKVDGDLDLVADAEGQGRLTGEIIVDQGSLTRPISIDRDFITNLLTPIDVTGTESSPLEQIELDLRLETRRGVRVHNNVADLAVGWTGVRVRGNLLEPVVDGQFVIEPGGRAYLFGQTLRVDSGVITFPGLPGAEAILDLETTSSLDDPSISRLAGESELSLEQPDTERARQTRDEVAAAFVSEQLETRVTEFVPAAKLTFRPILIFGEADPGARLTVGREFSRYVTLAASIDLRNAERQTYLMEAHSLPKLPGLVLQVFTNDLEQEGATLQHRLRFGSYRRTAPTGPTLRRLEIDAVPEVKDRALRRSVGLSKGDRASPDDLFLAEVEIGEFLRRAGYPDAQVEVIARPVDDHPEKVNLEVVIEPGSRAFFQFEGEDLPRSLQRSITPLYRSDFYEPQALEEMEAQTVRALRSLGILRPKVEVSVASVEGVDGREERHVTVQMQGGERIDLQDLEVQGLSEEDAAQAAAVFSTRVQLVELAVAETAADRRLLGSIRSLGYAEPEIVDRTLSQDGRLLSVEVEPGAQRHLVAIDVEGVEPERAAELQGVAGLEVGDVARRDRIASGALAIEADLRSAGFAKARVQPRTEVSSLGGIDSVDLVYEVDPGIAYTVTDAEIQGLRSTSRRWATNVAEMESGAPLREDEVYAARSRLYETGLFTMVSSETVETDRGSTEVIFDVEERPRFSAAYGFRWDNDEGSQGVIDVIDRNLLGRSVTLGLRALYKQDDWSVRLGAGVPRLFGTRAVLELFGTFRDTFDEISDELFTTQFDEQTVESSLQIAYPFGDRISGRVYGRYRVADLLVTEIDQDPIFPLPPTSLEFRFKTPLLGTLWIYDTRDRELVLTRGTFGSLDLSGTGEFLDSDFEYIRIFSQLNLYRRVGRWAGRNLGWAQSVRLGLADSFDQEMDRNDRFFAGGQYSVRGYPTDSLGPVEELGDDFFRPLGGKTLLVINEELRFDLFGPVAGVAFFDLGNVWEDTADFDSDLFKALGVGLRAVTPVGLLRLDFAFPLDRREGDPSSKLYFGFGNTF